MKTHADAGVELLRPADLSPLALSVVRDHHERIDGSGYPDGLIGHQVQEFPRIAAVADVYDAVTSERVYKPAAPPHVGVKVIRAGAGTGFCPNVVRAFRAVVMPYPVGHEIKLPDGRVGVVSHVDIAEPDVPTVRVKGAARRGRGVHGRHGRGRRDRLGLRPAPSRLHAPKIWRDAGTRVGSGGDCRCGAGLRGVGAGGDVSGVDVPDAGWEGGPIRDASRAGFRAPRAGTQIMTLERSLRLGRWDLRSSRRPATVARAWRRVELHPPPGTTLGGFNLTWSGTVQRRWRGDAEPLRRA